MSTSSFESVFLDTLDGFGFESLCERIFTKLDWGKVEKIGGIADGGRDILIHQELGSTVIECKHHPKSSIGRPVVQKLHSAVISSGAVRGIIVTTGKFSKEAIEHAANLSRQIPIELYDFSKLSELAQSAKIRLIKDGGDSMVHIFPVSDIPSIKETFRNELEEFQSYPVNAFDLFTLVPKKLHLEPRHVAKVNVKQDFSTSIGLIHSVNIKNQFLIFDKNCNLIPSQELRFFNRTLLKEYLTTPNIACMITRDEFLLNTTTLTDKIKDVVSSIYSENIGYYGNNNVHYVKYCKIGPRSITINDVKNALMPIYDLDFQCIKQIYNFELLVNGLNTKIRKKSFEHCKICYLKIHAKKLLCNDCGNICHSPKFFNSHSYVCKNCKKTICKNCTFYWRKLLFFKKILCEECANLKPKAKRRLVR